MVLSITEKSYLIDSLSCNPPIRPDGRSSNQFRPIEISTEFLSSSNGSSRIILSDGSECIVSVKSKVVDFNLDPELVVVDVDIAGHRDDSVFVRSIVSMLNNLILRDFNMEKLHLTKRYGFKLFVDVLVLCSSSYPLTPISLAIYSALNSTYLPKLVSNKDDLQIDELPMFHDFDFEKLQVDVPLLFTVAVIDDVVVVDPSSMEDEVACNGLVITWSNGTVCAPIRSIGLNEDYSSGFDVKHIMMAIDVIKECAPKVVKALNAV
ncbi:HCL084Cp [Eremothecium sinecaudum]|uniref:Ribosomal RNA-processing protein 42 n=1 Tax=Eremothecium sinecaudum TaxID=45286 RepID=A0A0X8HRF6_9SACH|nr:HCL084Cp [Eremothecium sinecaudum]AMD20067.1 HCL084Cp [Eremothecium sinecaudum]